MLTFIRTTTPALTTTATTAAATTATANELTTTLTTGYPVFDQKRPVPTEYYQPLRIEGGFDS